MIPVDRAQTNIETFAIRVTQDTNISLAKLTGQSVRRQMFLAGIRDGDPVGDARGHFHRGSDGDGHGSHHPHHLRPLGHVLRPRLRHPLPPVAHRRPLQGPVSKFCTDRFRTTIDSIQYFCSRNTM